MSQPQPIWSVQLPNNARNAVTNGSIVAIACFDHNTYVRNFADGGLLHVLGGHSMQVNDVAICNGYLATASYDFTSQLFDASTGALIRRFGTQGTFTELTSVDPSVYGRKVETVDLNPTFLAQGTVGGRVLIWRLDGTLAASINMPGPVRSVRFHPDGRLLVCGADNSSGASRGYVFILNDPNGNKQFRDPASLWAHNDIVTDAVWTDEGHVVSVSWDFTVKEWDANGALLLTSAPFKDGLECVGAGIGGKLIVGGGFRNLYLLATDLAPTATFDDPIALIESCQYSPGDADFIYSLSDGRVIRALPQAAVAPAPAPIPAPAPQPGKKKH